MPEITWVTDEFLVEQRGRRVDGAAALGVCARPRRWRSSIVWTSAARSRQSLTFRPLAETVRGALDHAETTDAAGLAPEREAALLAEWHGRG